MKAARYRKTGNAADVLEVVDIEQPKPKKEDVLIKLYTSGINPSDTKTRAGLFPLPSGWTKVVPHQDGAGVIVATGEGVNHKRIGERVWVHSAQWNRLEGTAAEYIAINSQNAIKLPDNIDFATGATLGVPLLTAYRAVTMNGEVKDKIVLIQGGAGAVGHYAIQIAKSKGATVIATVSSNEKAKAAETAGAHHIINYKTEDVVQKASQITEGQGVDHLIEVNLSSNAATIPQLVKNNGFVAIYGTDKFVADFPAVNAIMQQLQIGFFMVYSLPPDILASAIYNLTKLLSAGLITPLIYQQLPLHDIAKAHDLVDSKSTMGNVVLILNQNTN